MENKLRAIYERTLQNCLFFEEEGKEAQLLNEIGALRGVAYCLGSIGVSVHDEKFLRLIALQQAIMAE